jgi:teichuronic acid biosynthesis glycosyltransferase TuaH
MGHAHGSTIPIPSRINVPGRPTERLALAVADAGWFTTENLFREVHSQDVSTLLLKCMDWRNAWQKGLRPWSWNGALRQRGPGLWQREVVLPSGWMKKFPRLGMRPIARTIRNWQRALAQDSTLTLVMTYPHYLYLRDQLRPARSVYFNFDDYALYWPRHADEVRALERRAVRESSLTVCASHLRAEELRAAVPEAADRVRHLPHGAPPGSVSEHPWERPATAPADLLHLPRPLLGYVGSLEDRVDWRLLTRLSEAFPHASVVLIGRPAPGLPASDGWRADYARCLARPNVHALGWRPQESVPLYNRAFDVCLIPYRVDHPFNRACSPTKIMDSMGTGRPIVSTAIPECLLYGDLFDVAGDAETFVARVRAILDAGSNDGRAGARLDWARRNTCDKVAERFLDLLAASMGVREASSEGASSPRRRTAPAEDGASSTVTDSRTLIGRNP